MPRLDQLAFAAAVKVTLRYDTAEEKYVAVESGTPVPDDAITLSYRPRYYTREYEVQQVADAAGYGEQAIRRVLGLFESWDLEGADGRPIPLTEEGLVSVPTALLNTLYGAVLEQMAPGKPKPAS